MEIISQEEMEWPSTRVPQGGLFHPPKVNYNPDTRDYLKGLINESKLSIIQREKDRSEKTKKKTANLKSASESQLSPREPPLIRPGSSKRRTQDTIINSGAYIREKFVPKFPKVDRDKAKKHLQDLMAYGKDIQPPPPPKIIAKSTRNRIENRFDQLEREIKERKEFLQEMKELGEGPRYEQIIEQQIQAKLREMNSLKLEVWVSTENDLIYQEASKVNANIHWRSNETATDTASSLYATKEFLEKHRQIDFVALIQCTSPFLKVRYLQESVAQLNLKVYECVFSVTRSFKLRWIKFGYHFLPSFDIKNRPRRQDLNEEYIENGMFYFASRNLIEKGYFQNNR
ncbi:hypothetical protein RN001_013922 [Aquatica leii]|uniref:Uncharacterized protein n=1 Tax=Aquatica leii TaxID=1421715 RepID=A0AAN7SCL8_9COLE|nr:hypothetical protein RN001_013922 [Aquatica leii]